MTYKEMIGKNFGKLLVIAVAEKPDHIKLKGSPLYWKCICDCGTMGVYNGHNLRMGTTLSCGCIKNANLIEKRFGKLVVIERIGANNSRRVFWKCICDCGNFTKAETSSLRTGHTTSCGCVSGMHSKLEYQLATFNQLYKNYKRKADYRNLDFDLSEEIFLKLVKSNCFYCNSEPYQTIKSKYDNGDFVYNGIDRVNPEIGYFEDNVVSCCGKCNISKMAFTQSEFYNWVSKLSGNLKEKGLI